MIEPGIYEDLDEATYHADKDSLSVSGAKKLLPPSCPAIFKWQRDHGQPSKPAFDVGKAAHSLVLGTGAEVVVVDAANWMTKAAKEQRDVAYAAGKTPILTAEWHMVQDMADALSRHPIAKDLFQTGQGNAELSLFWKDDQHAVMRRARLDWLQGGAIPDYKTCQSADPASIAKAMASFRYHMQADWYREAVIRLGLAPDPMFVLVFQEKTAPYCVTVVEPDMEALRIGRALNEKALRIYADCTATDTWPGYSDDVELIALPKWATYIEDAA
jgi:hypothetical protein